MKGKILFALLLIGVFALGILSVRAWDKYQIQERVRIEAQKIEADARAQAAEMARQDAEKRSKEQFAKECKAGQDAWDALTLSEQKKMDRPVCEFEQVE